MSGSRLSETRRRNDPRDRSTLRNSERTRREILDAALKFLWTHPFRDLTVDELMSLAGSSRPAFYQCFEDLYDLMESLLRGLEEDLFEIASPWLQGIGNYDKLQDLAENHRSLRCMLGVGSWDDSTCFNFRRIHDTICQLKPQTLHRINRAIASSGQEIHGQARQHVRADWFVIETNIHYPSESSLIFDGVRKMVYP